MLMNYHKHWHRMVVRLGFRLLEVSAKNMRRIILILLLLVLLSLFPQLSGRVSLRKSRCHLRAVR